MGAVKRNTLSVLFIIKKAKLLKNGEGSYLHAHHRKQTSSRSYD